jgi:hypothetical protein
MMSTLLKNLNYIDCYIRANHTSNLKRKQKSNAPINNHSVKN